MVDMTKMLCQQSLGSHGNTQEAQWEMLNLAFSSNEKLGKSVMGKPVLY
jgi:hypothetical protein